MPMRSRMAWLNLGVLWIFCTASPSKNNTRAPINAHVSPRNHGAIPAGIAANNQRGGDTAELRIWGAQP